jgi:hypothetical protein
MFLTCYSNKFYNKTFLTTQKTKNRMLNKIFVLTILFVCCYHAVAAATPSNKYCLTDYSQILADPNAREFGAGVSK